MTNLNLKIKRCGIHSCNDADRDRDLTTVYMIFLVNITYMLPLINRPKYMSPIHGVNVVQSGSITTCNK